MNDLLTASENITPTNIIPKVVDLGNIAISFSEGETGLQDWEQNHNS
jgi:hypothetical protein